MTFIDLYLHTICISDHLCLWDTKFGTLVAKQRLQNSADGIKLTVSNLLYASNRIWLSTNQGITAFSVEMAPSTLSMAFGKQKMSDSTNRLPMTGQQWRIDEEVRILNITDFEVCN